MFMVKPYKVFRVVSWPIVVSGGFALFLQLGWWADTALRVHAGFNLRHASGVAYVAAILGAFLLLYGVIACAVYGLRDITARAGALLLGVSFASASFFLLANPTEAEYIRLTDQVPMIQSEILKAKDGQAARLTLLKKTGNLKIRWARMLSNQIHFGLKSYRGSCFHWFHSVVFT